MPRTNPATRIAASNLATALAKIEALDERYQTKLAVRLARDVPCPDELMLRALLRCAVSNANIRVAAKLARAIADAIECAADLDQHTNKHAVSVEVA